MSFQLTFARWLYFYFKHICLLLYKQFWFFLVGIILMFLPFYHFLYLSHLLIFNPASPLPFPILLILNPPLPRSSFPPRQSPQPPLKTLNAAAPALPPCG